MKLEELLKGVEVAAISGAGAEVSSVAYDSRRVERGGLFVALKGEKTDGNRFVSEAVERGAVAIASELPAGERGEEKGPRALPTLSDYERVGHPVPDRVAWIRVRNARKALATVAGNFYGRPAERLKLVGITGTKGKTTTSYVVDSILRAAGLQCGLFGTVEWRTPGGVRPAKNTTPESLELQSFLAEVRDAGGTHAAFEVSSHALALERVWGCPFAVAVFTNLAHDHLDFHKTFENYFAAKRRLFEGTGRGAPEVAVLNSDDPWSAQLQGLAGRTLTYGVKNGAEIATKKFSLGFDGVAFTAETPAGPIEVRSALVGRVNVYNILAAIGAAIGLGIGAPAIERGVNELRNVPGRFERVDEGQPFLVVVDYAHTPESLASLIETARELSPAGRVITVFGCGGDRDRSKRPVMGEAAGRLSHRVVLTSDNPRSEDPLRIINDVLVGLQKTQGNYVVQPDRVQAIVQAVNEAEAGDIVLIAGKGHERYQILGNTTREWSDPEEARKALRARYGVKE